MNKKIYLLGFILLTAFIVLGCTAPEAPAEKAPSPVVEDAPKETVEAPETIQEQQPAEEIEEVVDETKEETIKEEEKTATDNKPVLKNFGVDIEPWNKQTNLAGDLIFTKDLIFEDDYILNDWVFVEFGAQGQRKDTPNNRNIEYWFYVPLGTEVRAPVDGIVLGVGYIEHTKDWGISFATKESSPWFVSYEHLIDVTVKKGDIVKVGDLVGKASPRVFNKAAMFEMAVWTGGYEIYKYCPFDFLDKSLKPIYEEKLIRLAKDWEEFVGKDVYKQEDWVAPGCLLHNITER